MLTLTRRSLFRRARDTFFARWGLLDWLRLLSTTLVFWCELGSFYHALARCSWPDAALPPHQDRPAHVLLVADPQVRDLSVSRRVGFSALRQGLVDLALKRNWHFASRTRPHVVVFLGDLLASWRLIRSDEEYERNLLKFRRIFRLDPGVAAYYVPGNNDVGLNIDPAAARQARHRFATHFGPLNQRVDVRNHTLLMIDAAGLAEEDYLRAAKYIDYEHWTPLPHGPVEFVHSVRNDATTHPSVLFTHIPLYRPDSASCGPLREKGTIRRGVGPGYQNTFQKKTTGFLLQSLRPSMVFSADDKDYCDHVHVPPKPYGFAEPAQANDTTEAVREVTLKAFSPSHEIRYPGFQLLSLATPTHPGAPALADKPCFLPDYTSVYAWRYTPLLFLTILTLALLRLRKSRASPLPLHARRGGFRKSFSIHSLPADGPWLHASHPPTPFSPDWSPHTPGFVSPHAHRSPRASPSPTDELPRGLRTPLPPPADGSSKGSDAEYAPGTPTFRATTQTQTHARGDSLALAALVVFDADGDGDGEEFARGRHDPRRLGRAERGADEDTDAGPAPPRGLTFTLWGQRRRVSLGFGCGFGAFRGRGRGAVGLVPDGGGAVLGLGARRGGGKRAFVRRVGVDLVYVAWPAVVLWFFCAWWLR